MEEQEIKGGFASCYLTRYQTMALMEFARKGDHTKFNAVGVIILERLIAEELLPEVDLERYLEKIERNKIKPHGNSKAAKQLKVDSVSDEAPSEVVRRREIRKRRGGRTVLP